MNLRLSLTVVVFLLIAAGAGQSLIRSHAEPGTLVPGSEALDVFDRAVQRRFHNVIGFGMNRISTRRWFVPETTEEKDAVKALRHDGYEVCLYLVGRNILQDIPEERRKSEPFFGSGVSHLMSGPVFVGEGTLKGLPEGREMWEPAREALRKFDNGASRTSFEIAGWNIEARPVMASDDKCLSCHGYDSRLVSDPQAPGRRRMEIQRNQLRIGDTLGVLLYVHRKKD